MFFIDKISIFVKKIGQITFILQKKAVYNLVFWGCLLLCMASCGSSRKSIKAVSSDYRRDAVTSGEWSFSSDKDKVDIPETELVCEAKKWLGTPYVYGGKSRSGTDCSGFVMEVYRKTTSIRLPRTTFQQREFCENISRKELKPGDLVFFSSRSGKGKVSHVGMYLGAGQIIHASSSRGVIISDLSENYYARTYHSSGRVRGYKARVSDKPVQIPEPQPVEKETNLYDILDQAIEQRADSIYSSLLD